MSRTGLTRKIGGHVYKLAGVHIGYGALREAKARVFWLKAKGYSVRNIKVMPGYYRVYYRKG